MVSQSRASVCFVCFCRSHQCTWPGSCSIRSYPLGSYILLLVSRHSKSNVRKSNSIELNRTQSVDWVRLSSAIERNRTPHFQWVRFPNKSNSIEQIELNRTQSVWLCSIEFGNRTQSNTIKWISFDWLWWTYTKQAQSKPVKASFSSAFFTIYSISQTPFINCPR